MTIHDVFEMNMHDASGSDRDAEPSFDKCSDGLPFACAFDNAWLETSRSAIGDRAVMKAAAGGARKKNKVLLCKVFQFGPLPSGEPVRSREHRDELFLEYCLKRELFVPSWITEETYVDRPGMQGLELRRGWHFQKLQVGVRKLVAVLSDDFRNDRQCDGGRKRHAKLAGLAPPCASRGVQSDPELLKDSIGGAEQRASGFRQTDFARAAEKEGASDLVFEAANLLAQGGLGDTQTLGCLAKMKLFCNHDKRSQESEIQVRQAYTHLCKDGLSALRCRGHSGGDR